MSLEILQAESPAQLDGARLLFREYAAEWNLDLCFQDFDSELASLPGCYAAPGGRLLLASQGRELAGCVAVRDFSPGIAEMKRLYVRPAFRRSGLGRGLAERIIEAARSMGYQRMRLDTLARMTAAVTLYESLGFRRIEPYRPNPLSDVIYLELPLGAS